MSNRYIFSSESVGEGHPDKVADTISDAVLDACLAQDKFSRVACETYVKSNIAIIGGEITTKAKLDFVAIARKAIREIGYVNDDDVFHADKVFVNVIVTQQSPDIAQGVDARKAKGKAPAIPAHMADAIRRFLRGDPVKQAEAAEELADLWTKAEAGELVLLSQDEARFPMVPTLAAIRGVKGHRPTAGTRDCKDLLQAFAVVNIVTASLHSNLLESPARGPSRRRARARSDGCRRRSLPTCAMSLD